MKRMPMMALKSRKGAVELKADAVIVGSGAGGAAAAVRLSEKGMKVIVLEEGGYFQNTDMTQREDEMMPQLYRDGGSQVTSNGSLTVLQGRCVGGTTTINMGDASPIQPPILEYYRRHHGWSLDWDTLHAEQNWTAEMMGVQRIADPLLNRANSSFLAMAKARGWKGDVFNNFRTGCIGSGYCMVGCHYDAKRGVMLNLLPRAVSLGAEILTGALVDRVLLEKGVAKGVEGVLLEPGTPRESGGRFVVKAPRVIVSAGTIHSPGVLHRSGVKHPALGQNLTLQPHLPIFGHYKEEMKSYRGIPQAVFISEFDIEDPDTGLGGYRLEPVFSHPGMMASSIPFHGEEHQNLMRLFNHMGMTLLLMPDRPTGNLTFKGRRSVIHYIPRPDVMQRARKAMVSASQLHFDAGALAVYLPVKGRYTRLESLKAVEAALPDMALPRLISPHPQGTCRMGKDPATTVLDLKGQVRGAKNLWVMDGSVFPSTASHHITIPIVSTSSYLAKQVE